MQCKLGVCVSMFKGVVLVIVHLSVILNNNKKYNKE